MFDLCVPLFEGRDLILCLFQGIFPFPFFGLELFLLLPVQFGFRFGFIRGDGGGSVFAGYIDGGQLFLFLQVIIVVADIVSRVSSEFQNPGCGLVDEITVMGNVEDGSLVLVQGIFQYLLGSDVQMVGRLIKDDKIGLGEHQLSQ